MTLFVRLRIPSGKHQSMKLIRREHVKYFFMKLDLFPADGGSRDL